MPSGPDRRGRSRQEKETTPCRHAAHFAARRPRAVDSTPMIRADETAGTPPHQASAAPPAPSPAARKAKARDIIAAIRTLKRIEHEQRPATAEEKQTLARFAGFGPVALSIFPDPVTGRYKDAGWQALGEELQIAADARRNTTAPSAPPSTPSTRRRPSSPPSTRPSPAWAFPATPPILEPGCGTGNFMSHGTEGCASSASSWTRISGRIARALHPEHDIRIENFRDTKLPEDRIDAVIGNVPFADLKLDYHGQKLSLHDYFFAKSIDALKPGGVLALVTSPLHARQVMWSTT